ncbi:MAG: hypothetical protein N4A46_02095 [Schleiferiaceae bacterium]|nr:hypothetical protein [Schleiferiaceae bacterium]
MKTIFAMFISVIVIGYSGGLNIAKHFCKGKVVSKSFNYEVEECGGADRLEFNSCNPEKLVLSSVPCCKTESQFYKSFDFEKDNLVKGFVFEDVTVNKLEKKAFSAPLLKVNSPNLERPPPESIPIFIRLERFLI